MLYPSQRVFATGFSSLFFSMVFIAVFLICLGVPCAQEVPTKQETVGPVSLEEVQEKLTQLQENATLEKTLKSKLQESYTATLEQLRFEQERRQKALQFEQERVQAPERLQAIEDKLAKPVAEPAAPPEGISAADLNQMLVQAEADLAAAQKEKDELSREPIRRAERRKQIPSLIAEAAKRVEEAQAQLAMPSDPAQAPELQEARHILFRARIQANEAEKEACEKELRSYEARSQLLTRRQDEAVRLLSEQEARVAMLRERMSTVREQEAQEAAEQAEAASERVEEASPIVREITQQLAEENNELAEARTGEKGLLHNIEADTRALEKLRAELTQVKTDYELVQNMVDKQHLKGTVGILLREQRQKLRKRQVDADSMRERWETIERIEYAQLAYQKRRQELADIKGLIQTQLEGLPETLNEKERQELERILNDLYTAKRSSLDALIADCDSYIDLLVQLQLNEQELANAIANFSAHIEKHILWIRSADFLSYTDLVALWPAIRWFFSIDNWMTTFATDGITGSLIFYCAILALFVLTLFLRQKLKLRITRSAALAEKSSCVVFLPTLQVCFVTLLNASFFPLILAVILLRINYFTSVTPFRQGFSAGLSHVALFTITLQLVRQVIRSKGLGESHYGWSPAILGAIRKPLTLLSPWILLSVFLFSVLEWSQDPLYNDSLGRFAFIVALLLIGVLGHCLLRPGRGPISLILLQKLGRKPVFSYLSYLLHLSIVLILISLAVSGYYYTAIRLLWRVHGVILFAFIILVLHSLISRALLIARRRLAMEQARKRREALKQQSSEGEAKAEIPSETEHLDLAKVDARTQSLLRWLTTLVLIGGILLVWADVLPALEVLDEVHLWQTTQSISETILDEDGNAVASTEERVVWITLRHLGIALLAIGITWVLFRGLPDFLEIALLQHLSLGAGERYAITTIAGYCVLVIGVLFTFATLGIGWSKVQWLVAALGVGLGFGLQEIFANFMSGLIILFERPIRVGDTITIGGIDGCVSRIRIRATRIIDWDRKELIVPNKEFVTGQLINWTLSDQILRLIIPVGIAYGSDTKRAYEILHKIARQHPDILADPEPQVLFTAFGDSTLDFELRVFCPSINVFVRLKHDLHMAIDQAFREADIEIAFPQRDIHIRSCDTPALLNPLPPEGSQKNT